MLFVQRYNMQHSIPQKKGLDGFCHPGIPQRKLERKVKKKKEQVLEPCKKTKKKKQRNVRMTVILIAVGALEIVP